LLPFAFFTLTLRPPVDSFGGAGLSGLRTNRALTRLL